MSPVGVSDCGQAHNCVEVRPKKVPTVTGIGQALRQATIQWCKDLFNR